MSDIQLYMFHMEHFYEHISLVINIFKRKKAVYLRPKGLFTQPPFFVKATQSDFNVIKSNRLVSENKK